MCHFLRSFPEDIFNEVFILTCVLPETPIICACFAVTWRIVIFRTSATSFITFRTKTETLSVFIEIGRFACLVLMLMISFAVLMAVEPDIGYANAYLQNPSIAVMIIVQPSLGGSSESRSVCMTSFKPKSHSGTLMSSGVFRELSVLLSWMQV